MCTARVAYRDRIGAEPSLPGLTWHWKRPSSSSVTGRICSEYVPALSNKNVIRTGALSVPQ